jgi:hypothetical protein
MALASAPRPYVRLLALNAGRWPRQISEDRLIPDHVVPSEKLDPLPISDADRRDFQTIMATAKAVAISYSRRDVEGRLLGRSPLVADLKETYLARARIPLHAASESDRLQARPAEFQSTPMAVSAAACWRDWFRKEITTHDGLARANHPLLNEVFNRPLSATSLRLLLRDPIRFVWRYGLGWKQPEQADEPLTVEPLDFGTLVHDLLQRAVDALGPAGGIAQATTAAIELTIERILSDLAREWESAQPVPPPLVWRSTLGRAREMSLAALAYPLAELKGQTSWTEIPFGTPDREGRQLPWDAGRRVEIPGTGIRIQGHIDRLDLSSDREHARVIDYKTGRLTTNMADVVIKGGAELQRCLYAFAVKTLLGPQVKVEAALLYPGAPQDEQALFPLRDVNGVLDRLAAAIELTRCKISNGALLPGVDAADPFNDFAFALPASPVYLPRKMPLASDLLGEATKIWEEP